MPDQVAAFLDTSIQIARLIHAPAIRQQIEKRISTFDFTATSLVVQQEFKRRLLKDALYLLALFERYGSFAKVQRHIVDVLTPFQKRKRQICLQVLTSFFETDSDEDLTDRSVLLLNGLVRDGLYEFEQSVDHVITKSGCACATQQPRKRGNKYEFGPDKCSAMPSCTVDSFLDSHRPQLEAILVQIDSAGDENVSEELRNAAKFIRSFMADPDRIRSQDPCKTVGDLLIALESA